MSCKSLICCWAEDFLKRSEALMAANTNPKKKSTVAKVEEPSPYSPAQIKKFLEEVKVEFLKIVWPDKKMTMGLTGIVLVLTFVISIYLGSVDLLLGKLISSFLR
jgi:preprotein translocase subunit SecE